MSRLEDQWVAAMQQMGEEFLLYSGIASDRYKKEGFDALVAMVQEAPHDFPDKTKTIYQAAAVTFMLHCPHEMKQFNHKMLKACPGNANIQRLAAELQLSFDASDRATEAEKRRADIKVIKS